MSVRNSFFSIIFLFIVIPYSYGDTTDYYYVFYNNIKINKYTGINADTLPLIFKKADIKNSDVLIVKYWDDSPCEKCKFFLVVIDDKKQYVKVVSNTGQGSPLSVPLAEIIEWSKNNDVTMFEVYYYEEKPAFPIHLFKVILE